MADKKTKTNNMKKFSEFIGGVREANEAKKSELQKSYQDYFQAKLDKYGAKSPADLDVAKKKEFFNEIAADWEAGKGVKDSAKEKVAKEKEDAGIKEAEAFIAEALTSKTPNEVETIDADLAYEPSEKKDVMAVLKKFNITAKENGANNGMGYDLTGKKKDLIAYLQSEYYEMEDTDIKELYPELLEGNNLDEAMVQVAGKSKPSGAKVLATVIMKYLEDSLLVPANANKKSIEAEIAQLIMDSTF